MLPDGWDTYELGDLAEFKSGGTPSKQNAGYWGGGFPWVSAKDLKTHYITKAELGLTASGELQANIAPIESILGNLCAGRKLGVVRRQPRALPPGALCGA